MDSPDLVPLSALQHWRYCPRQCALIHLEQAFEENIHTLRGQAVHARADQPGVEVRAGLRVERPLPVFSDASPSGDGGRGLKHLIPVTLSKHRKTCEAVSLRPLDATHRRASRTCKSHNDLMIDSYIRMPERDRRDGQRVPLHRMVCDVLWPLYRL
jgi:hypothetical protein